METGMLYAAPRKLIVIVPASSRRVIGPELTRPRPSGLKRESCGGGRGRGRKKPQASPKQRQQQQQQQQQHRKARLCEAAIAPPRFALYLVPERRKRLQRRGHLLPNAIAALRRVGVQPGQNAHQKAIHIVDLHDTRGNHSRARRKSNAKKRIAKRQRRPVKSGHANTEGGKWKMENGNKKKKSPREVRRKREQGTDPPKAKPKKKKKKKKKKKRKRTKSNIYIHIYIKMKK